jgi:hypothetical protein
VIAAPCSHEEENPNVKNEPEQSLLVDRHTAAQLLDCHVITVIRMEQDGELTPVRLREGKCAKSYYERDELREVIKKRLALARERQRKSANA